jgi:hypothetical protein
MEVVDIVKGVITKQITSYAEKTTIDRRKVQLSLFIDSSSNKAEGKMLVNYQVSDSVKIKNILGFYSLMYSLVDTTICNSLKRFAKEYNVSDYEVFVLFWLKDGNLEGWIYSNGQAKKKIAIEDILV